MAIPEEEKPGLLTSLLVSTAGGATSFPRRSLLQVVLMSATINCREFADYFAVPVQNKMNPAYVFEVEGKPFSIEEYYLNDLEHVHHSRVCWNALFVLQ